MAAAVPPFIDLLDRSCRLVELESVAVTEDDRCALEVVVVQTENEMIGLDAVVELSVVVRDLNRVEGFDARVPLLVGLLPVSGSERRDDLAPVGDRVADEQQPGISRALDLLVDPLLLCLPPLVPARLGRDGRVGCGHRWRGDQEGREDGWG